jgi:hypothetical protein
MSNPKIFTRREFLRLSTASGMGLLLSSFSSKQQDEQSKVIVVENAEIINANDEVNSEEAERMINWAIKKLTNTENIKNAWEKIGIFKQDVVGIKINCNLFYGRLCTHSGLVFGLANSLSRVVPENNIIIWDRTDSELTNAGYPLNLSGKGVRCFGTNSAGGYDEGVSRILTRYCSKLINVPVLKYTGGDFRATLFFKNNVGCIRDMARCHGDVNYLAYINNLPPIRDKTKLVICDATRGMFKKGRDWFSKKIVVSQDSVAAEWICLKLLSEKRQQEGLSSLCLSLPSFLKVAEKRYKLGTSQERNIELIEGRITSIEKKGNLKNNKKIFSFSIPNPAQKGCYLPTFLQNITNVDAVKIEIYSNSGQLLREIPLDYLKRVIYWDGKDNRGRVIPSGRYFYRVIINNSKYVSGEAILLR